MTMDALDVGADESTSVWVDYDPSTFRPASANVRVSVKSDGRGIRCSGKFDPWGYAAMFDVPESLRRPGPVTLRAFVNVIDGAVGVGVSNKDGSVIYSQAMAAGAGRHLIEVVAEHADAPEGVVIRYGSDEAGESAFEVEVLQFLLKAGNSPVSLAGFEATAEDLPYDEHPIFSRVPAWSGVVQKGFVANWVGTQTAAHFNKDMGAPEPRVVSMSPPAPTEEYFEWIDVLETVIEAQDRYTMVELGAGWGRWTVDAWSAIRQLGKTDMKVLFVGVEAEPEHYQFMVEHFVNNGLDPAQHRLIEAAVTKKDGSVYFAMGHSDEWYGQAIVNNERVGLGPWDRASVREVKAISLATALADVESVDLLDMDIQGAEADVVAASGDLLNERVRRVHIGTHGDEIENRLRREFKRLNWRCLCDYPNGRVNATPYGRITFIDGAQTWLNPRLA